MKNKKRILSGVQPTGDLHIGNWLGAINNWVELQEKHETFLCVVDLHAITTEYDPKQLSKNTLSTAALYIACGINPKICSIFVQSQISAHSELCWILNCMTPINWMERMIQFKEKSIQQGNNVSIGLFDYPILMAADILLYDADYVPVGEDQKQHLELARDIAQGVIEWSGQTLIGLTKLHGPNWLVAGAFQAISAAYLTRVVSSSLADFMALTKGVSEPDLEFIKENSDKIVERAFENEKINWKSLIPELNIPLIRLT